MTAGRFHPLTKWIAKEWGWVTPAAFALGAWGVAEYLGAMICFVLSGAVLFFKCFHWETPYRARRILGLIGILVFTLLLCSIVNIQRDTDPLSKTYSKWKERQKRPEPPTPVHNPPGGTSSNPKPLQPQPKPKAEPFPKHPLTLLDYNAFKGGTIQNNSDEQLFLLGFRTTIAMSTNEDSISFPIDQPIGRHGIVSFDEKAQFSVSTLSRYASSDWDQAEAAARAQYKQCLHAFAFAPEGIQIKQLETHYAGSPFPEKAAIGIITYRRGSESKEQRVPLEAVMFVDHSCSPE